MYDIYSTFLKFLTSERHATELPCNHKSSIQNVLNVNSNKAILQARTRIHTIFPQRIPEKAEER